MYKQYLIGCKIEPPFLITRPTSYIIMNTTELKCLQIHRTSLLPDIQDLVKSFAFRELKSYEMQHKHKMHNVLQTIDDCYSRKNGFRDKEDVPDSENEHWWIAPLHSEEFAMQAINCKKCGNYLLTSTYDIFFSLSECSVCTCDRLLTE